jgi:DNA-binding NarL/FixJ family response regulator
VYKQDTTMLTRAQVRVIQAIADEGSYKLAARKLRLSTQTVKNHLQEIQRRLGAKDKTHACVIAWTRGWIV